MTTASLIGIPCGVGCAVLQSIAYVVSRHFTVSRGRGAGIHLIVLVHLWMGLFAAVTLPIVWVPGVPWDRVIEPLLAAAFFKICGQVAQTIALHLAEPSRVSPLMSIKVFVPALLTMLFGAPAGAAAYSVLNAPQWIAIGLCAFAGASISRGGGGMKVSALVAIAATIILYSASDWSIGMTIGRMLTTPGIGKTRAALLVTASLYLLTPLGSLAVLPTRWGGSSPERWTYHWADWRDSLPYAACWFLAMIVLFVAIGEVGLVYGMILQSTRAFITIGLGAALMYLGVAHIEPKQPHRVVVIRAIAGALMTAAIAMYIWNK